MTDFINVLKVGNGEVGKGEFRLLSKLSDGEEGYCQDRNRITGRLAAREKLGVYFQT